MPGPGSVACPKPEPRKRAKARRKRAEGATATAVRAIVARRDGACRFLASPGSALHLLLGPCEGPSQWAHLKGHQRWETRGMSPEDRHTSVGSIMACWRHHESKAGYDRHAFDVVPLTGRGADGPLRIVKGGEFVDETVDDS